MTEPPEPRDPTGGGGEEDPLSPEESRELDDFLNSEQFAELEDDMILDRLGSGEEPSFEEYLAMGDDEAALTDEAANWRDEIDEEPLPPKLDTDAIIAEHERRKKAVEPPGPRTPETGGQSSMINEGAQILANAATNADTVRGLVNSAEASVRSAAAALQEAAGVMGQISGEVQTAAGGAEGDQLGGMGQQASAELDQLLSNVAMFDPNQAMGLISQFFEAVSQAAQRHSS